MIKVAVIGSRTFTDYELLKQTLNDMEIDILVSGGAIGADKLAERYSDEKELNGGNIPIIVIKPDWQRYGKSAGFMRNTIIIENCDKVVAFWDGESKGTKDSIQKARKMNKPVLIVEFKN